MECFLNASAGANAASLQEGWYIFGDSTSTFEQRLLIAQYEKPSFGPEILSKITKPYFCNVKVHNNSLHHSMENFLQGAPPIEVYRAPIENEVCRPAFAIERGSLWSKHEVGCELTHTPSCLAQTPLDMTHTLPRPFLHCVCDKAGLLKKISNYCIVL